MPCARRTDGSSVVAQYALLRTTPPWLAGPHSNQPDHGGMRCVGVCAQMRDLAVGRQQGEHALMKQSMQFEFEKLLKQQLETRILALSEQVQTVKQAAEHSAQKLGF